MTITDAVKKLEEMRESGGLTDAEFAAAKDVIIAIDESAIEVQIEKLRRQRNEIEQLDRDWAIERERYMVTEKSGNRVIPSRWGSVVNAIVIVVFGICWVSVSMIGETPFWFPLLGVLAGAAGLAACAQRYRIASAHDASYERYQRRREALLDRHDDE